MRADRLVAILLLLQAHGKMTVAQLAEQLETSPRTVRRDLDALLMTGVPLYPVRGRGGGWQLLGGYKVDLTGLTSSEAQSLLLALAHPAVGVAATAPGAADTLEAVRRKLLAALPPSQRSSAEAATASVLVDESRWSGPPPGPPAPGEADEVHLAMLRAAVLEGAQVDVVYEPPGRPAEGRRLHPLGLVVKRGVWYLVATTPRGLRTYRLSRVRAVERTGEPVERPPGFDLRAAWSDIQDRVSALSAAEAPLEVVAHVRITALGRLRATVGSWWPIDVRGPVAGSGDDLVEVRIGFTEPADAAAELVAFADRLTVISPAEVRAALADVGRALVDRYAG